MKIKFLAICVVVVIFLSVNYDEMQLTWGAGDVTPPIVNITAPIGWDNSGVATVITFTDDELTDPQCSIDNTNWVSCVSGVTTLSDITGFNVLADGQFTLYLKDIDLSGNTGTDSEVGIFKDTTTAPTVNAGLDKAIGAQFTQDATVSDLYAITTYAWSKVSGPGNITFGSFDLEDTTILADTDGVYVIRLTATNSLGNSAYDEMQLTWGAGDVTPPTVNIFAPLYDAMVNGTNEVIFSDNEPTNPQCSIDNVNWVNCVSSTTTLSEITGFTSLPDGVFNLYLRDIDSSNNTGADTETGIVKDSTNPVVNAGTDKTSGVQISQDATVSDFNLVTYEWTKVSGPGNITFGSFDLEDTTILADTDGVYVIRLTAIDLAGNSAYDEMQLTWGAGDVTPPTVNITAPIAGTDAFDYSKNVNGTKVITFTDNELTNAQCSIDNTNWVGCASGITTLSDITGFNALPDDLFTLYLKDTDAANNVGTDSEVDIRKYTSAPNVSAGTDAVSGVQFTQDATATISGMEGSIAYVWSKTSGPGAITFGSVVNHTEDTTISADTNGVYIIRVTATDGAGNSAYDEMQLTWGAGDVTPPTVNITAPIAGTDAFDYSKNVNGTKVITFTDNELTNAQCSIDNTNWVGCASGITTLSDITGFNALPDDLFTLYLKDTDAANNVGTDSEVDIRKYTSAPNVSAGTDAVSGVQFTQDATATISGMEGSIAYVWSKTSGPGAITFGSVVNHTEDTTISADTNGVYIIRVTATDGAGNSAYDEMQLTWTGEPNVEIISFDAISNIDAGTAGAAIFANAAAIQAILAINADANSGAVTVPVASWTDTDSYNPNVAGSYTFTAVLGAIPAGFLNTGNHTATLEVVVDPVQTYAVTFDTQGGSAVSSITGITSGATITLPTPPIKASNTFTSWNTAANGSGTAFTNATAVNANITVYAQWTLITTIAPDGNGEATLSGGVTEVTITDQNQAVDVAIADGTVDPTIDVSGLISGGTGTLPGINIDSNVAEVAIPAGAIVSSNPSWDGIISAPTVTTVTLPVTEGQTKTLGLAIEVGSLDSKLTFDNAVRILLPNQAGKRAGFVSTGENFTEITDVCSADSQATGNALTAGGNCKIDVGNDLVIWTKHFTIFAAYTQTSVEDLDAIADDIPRPKIKFDGSKKTFLSYFTGEKSIKLSSTVSDLAGGKVKIKKDGKTIEEDSIDGSGDWQASFKLKKTTEIVIVYLNEQGEEVMSKRYKIKIDSEDPIFTDLPNLLSSKHAGDKLWWTATDNQKIDHYKYKINGLTRKTKNAFFIIPTDIKTGFYLVQISAYDKAGNKTTKDVGVWIRK
jgi:hypothetical protein